MKSIFVILLLALVSCNAQSTPHSHHTIAFYNVENLFDTKDDPSTHDEEFTPKGRYRWNKSLYEDKLSKIERVICDISNNNLPTVIALAEVENRTVVEDLASTRQLRSAEYQVVHYDSPDRRGIDVAMMYRPNRFSFEGSKAIRNSMKGSFTRDILTMWGTIDQQRIFIIALHAPARLEGVAKSEHKRITTARQVRHIVDSVQRADPSCRVVVMGDFNDNPNNKSLKSTLKATSSPKGGELFNPFYKLYMDGYGTQVYRDTWSLYDNIIVSSNLKLQSYDGYYGAILKRPYMMQQNGRFKGYPNRSFVSGRYFGGYSDHLPVYITF